MMNKKLLYIVGICACIYIVFVGNKKFINNSGEQSVIKEDKLISRELLFGNPDRISVRISNDGKKISFLAPKDGVLNVWVADLSSLDQAKVITDEKQRGIREYFWAKDNEHVIYAQDKKGDENWRLYSVNIKTLEQKDLTPTDNVRASVLKLSNKFPNEMLINLNDRVPEYFDIYKVDINTGKRKLVHKNTEKYSSFVVDEDFNICFGYKMLPSGEGEVYIFENADISKPKLFQKISVEDMLTTNMLHLSSDGSKLFMIDSTDRDTSALMEINLQTMERKIIHQDSRADINSYLVDAKTKMIQGVSVEYLRTEWTILDPKLSSDIDYLSSLEEGDLQIVSRSYEDDKWIVAFANSHTPHKYYLYNRQEKPAKFLFSSNAKQEKLPFAKMHPVQIKARDGLELVSYLTVPKWLDNGSGIPSHVIPLVLKVHGGPNARDSWGLSAVDQWLANRGYAVLNVNYRGSTGFGKGFINAGDGEWARKMQDDLADAVNWAIEQKITDKDKVVIMGGSYGGYAALVGMSMTPDMYVAGIDIVGPSNLETLLNSIPSYWKPHMAHLTKMIGASKETEAGRKYLAERSPLTYAKDIKKPLMIVQGANDPRVKQAESDQIVESMKKHDIPVVYLLYSDEGHGLARPENRLSMYANAEVFLANFANGRFMPHDNKFPGSSIEIKEGKDISWIRKE